MAWDQAEWDKKFRLAERLVDREVYYCVSYLISTLSRVACECRDDDLDYDEIMNVCVQDDWEEPAIEFIRSDADLDELEEIADQFGYWSDVLEESWVPEVYESTCLPGQWGFMGCDSDCYNDEDDACEAAIKSVLPIIREKVEALVDAEACGYGYEWVGQEFSLDPEQREAYEHWLVSGWFAKRLRDEGEMVGEVCGLTVWGRCTTGQSIAMDGVVQKIACDIWPEECNGSSNS